MKQEKLEKAVIKHYTTNYENGINTISRIFDQPSSVISKIVNKYIKSIKKTR